MLTSKGCLNSDQRDSQIESSQGSFIKKKCWEEKVKRILLYILPILEWGKGY